MNGISDTAALAAIGAAARELKLLTVRADAARLAEIAVRERQTHLAYLAEILSAEIEAPCSREGGAQAMSGTRRKAGRLGPQVEGYRAWLAQRGYTPQTVHRGRTPGTRRRRRAGGRAGGPREGTPPGQAPAAGRSRRGHGRLPGWGRTPAGTRRLFLTSKAPRGPIRADLVGDVVERACVRAGLPRVGPHRLRHALAAELLRQGAGLVAISQVLRHQDLATTTARMPRST